MKNRRRDPGDGTFGCLLAVIAMIAFWGVVALALIYVF